MVRPRRTAASPGGDVQEWVARWAEWSTAADHTSLTVAHEALPLAVHGAVDATGLPLVTNGELGADLLRLPAGSGFVPHTHIGHHVLVIVGGQGTLTYGGEVLETNAGEVYLVDGGVPHAVGALTDHVILAVGAPHMPVDSTDRMQAVAYAEVLSPAHDLTCTICEIAAHWLHDTDCPHCPCAGCVG